jgi:hypothetical protein
MTPVELLIAAMRTPALSIAECLAVVFVATLVHECGHVTAGFVCGVPSVELRIGSGPRMYLGTIGACKLVLGLALPFGASTLYGEGIRNARPRARAFMAGGGAIAEGTAGLLALGLALLHAVPLWLWLFAYFALFDAAYALTPLHSDGRKVTHWLSLARNESSKMINEKH